MNGAESPIETEEGCEQVLTWNTDVYTVSVGIFTALCGERQGYFLQYDEAVDMHLRSKHPLNILYENTALWQIIHTTLDQDGIRLVTPPPANVLGPPPGAL